MSRITSFTFIAIASAASWLAMMAVHELGHVLAAWSTRGKVAKVVLHPLAISRTDLSANPHPVIVSLSGPAFGSAMPVVAWLVARSCRARHAFLWRFFAGFCLIANGAYLASILAMPVGDAEDVLRLGVPRWPLGVSGALAAATGLALWNGTGASFGLDGRPVDRHTLTASIIALGLLIAGMLLWSWLT